MGITRMKNIILLVQSDADVKCLPNLPAILKAIGTERVWGIVSPAVVISEESAAAKFDEEITALKQTQDQAVKRRDFKSADAIEEQIQGKQLDKSKAVNDAWRALSSDELKAKFALLLKPLSQELDKVGVKARFSRTQEHFQTDNYVNMLNGFLSGWDEMMPHGSYAVAWPRAFSVRDAKAASVEIAQPVKPSVKAAPTSVKPAVVPGEKHTKHTKESLAAMRYFGLKAVAEKHGVLMVKGMEKSVVIDQILQKQAA